MGDEEKRPAYHSRDGYDYQLDQAIVKWLKLGPEDVLLMEGKEDFDLFGKDGSLLVQTKKTKETISLNRAEIIKTISRYLENQLVGGDGVEYFVYSTTGTIAFEKGKPFGEAGILLWQKARDCLKAAESIRTFFATLDKAPESLKKFADECSNEVFQEKVIRGIYWNSASKSTEGLFKASIELIRARLKETEESSDTLFCKKIYYSLYVMAAKAASGRLGESRDDRKLTLFDLNKIFESHTTESISIKKRRELEQCAVSVSNADGVEIRRSSVSAAFEQLDESASSDLREVDDLILAGKTREASEKLDILQNSQAWEVLTVKVKAQMFLQRARVELVTEGSAEQALGFVNEARSLDSEGDFSAIEARLMAFQEEHQEVVDFLKFPKNEVERRIKAVALMNLDEHEEALKILRSMDESAEVLRLKGSCFLATGEVSEAKIAADRAIGLQPDWFNLRELQAVTYYALGSGWKSRPFRWTEFPVPILRLSLPTDTDSMGLLAKAKELFSALAGESHNSEASFRLRMWALACECNHRDQQTEGKASFDRLIDKFPCHPSLVLWGAARNLGEDWGRQITHFEKLCSSSFLLEHAHVLSAIYRSSGGFVECQELLEKYAQNWKTIDSPDWQWNVRQLRLDAERQGIELNLPELNSSPEDDEGRGAEGFSLAGMDSEYLATTVLTWYAGDLDSRIMESADTILEQIPSERLLEIVAHTFLRNQKWKDCLAVVEKNRQVFRGGKFSTAVNRMRIECFERDGDFLKAVDIAKKVFNSTKNENDRSQRDRLNHVLGRHEELRVSARQLLKSEKVMPESLLPVAFSIRGADRTLAKKLVQRILPSELTAEQALCAWELVFELNIDTDLPALLKKVNQPTESGEYLVEFFDKDELLSKMKQLQGGFENLLNLYRSGQLPIHVDLRLLRNGLKRLMGGEGVEQVLGAYQGCFASRKRSMSSVSNSKNAALFLDVTTIALVDRFQLWFPLSVLFESLQVSPKLPLHLTMLIDSLSEVGGDEQKQLVGLRQTVVEKIESGELKCAVFERSSTESEQDDSGLEEISFVKLSEDDYVSIDDRFATSFKRMLNGPRIACFANLLNLCESEGELEKSDFFEIRHQLRQIDYRYLPPSIEEVMFALREGVLDGVFNPDSRLAKGLSRYMTRCLLDADDLTHLNPQHGEDPDHSEFLLLFSGGLQPGELLAQIWMEDGWDLKMKHRLSDWIFESVLILPSAIAAIRSNYQPPAEIPSLFRTQIIFGAISLIGKKIDGESILDEFISWFVTLFGLSGHQLLELIEEIAKHGRKSVSENQGEPLYETLERQFWVIIMALTRHASGRKIMSQIDPRLIPDRIRSPIKLGSLEFIPYELWSAATSAFLEEEPVTLVSTTGSEVVLMADPKGKKITFRGPAEEEFNWKEDVFHVVFEDWHLQKDDSFLDLMDRSSDAEGELKNVLSGCGSGPERFHDFMRFRESLAYSRVLWMRESLPKGEMEFQDAIPPAPNEIYRYLCLEHDESKNLSGRLEEGAKLLIERWGVVEAFWRYSFLPIDLPEVLHDACRKLDAKGRNRLLNTFAREGNSLIQLIHYSKAFGSFGWQEMNFDPRRVVVETECFEGALQMCWSANMANTEDFSEEQNLLSSWVWSGVLVATLNPDESDEMCKGLELVKRRLNTPVFKKNAMMNDDVLHPQRFSRGRFLAGTLSIIGHQVNDLRGVLGRVLSWYDEQAEESLMVYDGFDDLLKNELGSFLNKEISEDLVTMIVASKRGLVLPRDQRDSEIQECFARLSKDKEDGGALMELGARLGRGPICEDWADSLLGWMSEWRPRTPSFEDVEVMLPAKLASWFARYGSKKAQEQFDKSMFLKKVVETFPEDADTEQVEQFMPQLLEIVFQLSYNSKSSEREYAAEVITQLRKVAEGFPNLRSKTQAVVTRILLHQHSRLEDVGWRDLLAIRLLRGKKVKTTALRI